MKEMVMKVRNVRFTPRKLFNNETQTYEVFYEELDIDAPKKKLILFLDEINTNENVNGILKEILIEKKMNGSALPENFIPIAAANPYKFKDANELEENTDCLKIRGCENN